MLIDGDLILTESKAIMKYVCYKKGETTLYPSDPKTRATIDEAIARSGIIKQGVFIPQLFGYVDSYMYFSLSAKILNIQ